jgi:hypothetical protein
VICLYLEVPVMLIYFRFLVDLSRWRFTVNDDEKPMFDQFMQALWGENLPDPKSYSAFERTENTNHFHVLSGSLPRKSYLPCWYLANLKTVS